MLTHMHMPSPIGSLLLAADDAYLREIWFEHSRYPRPAESIVNLGVSALLLETQKQLDGYFAGTRRHFDLPLKPRGTDFQLSVWAELAKLDYGVTTSYLTIATRLGQPSATRAVGAANGRNPMPIVIPCHRVIGANGALTGFGGGLPVKEFLLRREGAIRREDLFST